MGSKKRLHTRLTLDNYAYLCAFAGANSSISLNDAINRILQEHREKWHQSGTIPASSLASKNPKP